MQRNMNVGPYRRVDTSAVVECGCGAVLTTLPPGCKVTRLGAGEMKSATCPKCGKVVRYAVRRDVDAD